VRSEVFEIPPLEDLLVGSLRWLIPGEQHLVGSGGEQRREVAGGGQSALSDDQRIARPGVAPVVPIEFHGHLHGAQVEKFGIPGRTCHVAGHAADGDGLCHGVADDGRVGVVDAGGPYGGVDAVGRYRSE